MELSKQVVSLGLAKKLKELGVKIEALYCWYEPVKTPVRPWIGTYTALDIQKGAIDDMYVYPAYTASELMEMMPCYLGQSTEDNGSGYLICYRVNNEVDEYECSYDGKDIGFVSAETAVDAYALMLIKLIQDNLWKPTNYLP